MTEDAKKKQPGKRIAPKSTHHEQPMVRAVQNTASSRTFFGSFFDADPSMASCTTLASISRG